MTLKPGTYFKGQLENIVFIGKILDVYKKDFITLDLIQLSPQKVEENSVVWPYKAAKDLKHTCTITKEQFDAMKNIVGSNEKGNF